MKAVEKFLKQNLSIKTIQFHGEKELQGLDLAEIVQCAANEIKSGVVASVIVKEGKVISIAGRLPDRLAALTYQNTEYKSDLAMAILYAFINPEGFRIAFGDQFFVHDRFRQFLMDKWNAPIVAYQIKLAV